MNDHKDKLDSWGMAQKSIFSNFWAGTFHHGMEIAESICEPARKISRDHSGVIEIVDPKSYNKFKAQSPTVAMRIFAEFFGSCVLWPLFFISLYIPVFLLTAGITLYGIMLTNSHFDFYRIFARHPIEYIMKHLGFEHLVFNIIVFALYTIVMFMIPFLRGQTVGQYIFGFQWVNRFGEHIGPIHLLLLVFVSTLLNAASFGLYGLIDLFYLLLSSENRSLSDKILDIYLIVRDSKK